MSTPAQQITTYTEQTILNRVFDPATNRLSVDAIEGIIVGNGSIMQIENPSIPDAFTSNAVAGTGSITTNHRFLKANSGGTATSTAIVRDGTGTNIGWSVGSDPSVLNWSKRVVWDFIFEIADNTSTGFCRVLWGPNGSDAIKDLDHKGIGIVVDNLALKLQTHDSTDLVEIAASPTATLTVDLVYGMTIISDGAGNVEWFLNGVSQGTSAGGPVGNSDAAHHHMNLQAGNGANAANQSIVVHSIYQGVAV